jgi:hypothetical protein
MVFSGGTVSKSDTAARLLDTMELLLPEKPAAAAAASALISQSPEPAGTEEVIDKLKPPEPN